MRRLVVLALLGLVVAACGGPPVATTTSIASTTTSGVVSTTTTQPTTATTTEDTTTSTAPAPDVEISGGTAADPDILIDGPDLFSYTIGDEVSIRIQSSVEGELHVHGYNLFFALAADGITEVAFRAEIPGIFEAELEDTHTLVFEIEVTP